MTPLVPLAVGDSSQDTALGRPRDGVTSLVPAPSEPSVTETILLVGGAGAPESLRVHIARTLEMEWIEATFAESGADLQVTLTGPGPRVEDALEVLPSLYLAARRRRR